ncbi:MAG: valine--tRNA ligase [Planctomycetota bacterium]|nr:MAG: valine--tRNA ligase [Planctomycetota bacterium]
MSSELPKSYDPAATEPRIAQRWLDADAFRAVPDEREDVYVIMMPLPNVTGALHMGHAMDNVMQDLLIRWHRMQGANTLWQPGTDHAGIATQAVVEKRLKELEGKTRHDIGREELVRRIWQWKDEYQRRIVRQQQAMGCSCDWKRQRFTMDPVCSAAVREAFFRLFRDRLIYRGDRLVNWDCTLQTAVANDEVYHETVPGHFWHLRYPVVDPRPGEPEFVVVATTRPETLLGDTAVACHPDPAGALQRLIAAAEAAGDEEKAARLRERRQSHLEGLERLRDMAREGRKVRLPLLGREIPLICDEWAKPELGSGCVKITPGHDPNDYEVWTRHREEIGIINILRPDGTLNEKAGPYAGLDRFVARERVLADLEAQGLLERVEDRAVEIGHSDRSKTPIEPYLCKQWWVRMGDVEGGIVCGRGTQKEHVHAGLAQAAIEAANGPWRSPSGRKVAFHPDAKRYRTGYTAWLAEKRDWCISRQLWWGHRIPVWWRSYADAEELAQAVAGLPRDTDALHAWVGDDEGRQLEPAEGVERARRHPEEGPFELQVCLRSEAADQAYAEALEALGLAQDPDVLDTWFSSALWPFSTLGWPDPDHARVEPGQRPLGPEGERPSALDYYYPGSCLVTGRDILTLWVARMVVMGLYCMGDVPFTDVFLHCKILDGKGQGMSKSKGNGVDPTDIIAHYGADGMRYVICDMQTGTQDARLPVQAHCPNPACPLNADPERRGVVELAEAQRGRTIFTYLCPTCGAEFDMLGTLKEAGVPQAKAFSNRFDEGKNFCNKLWNAARFALLNLGQLEFVSLDIASLPSEDRWILSRLSRTVASVHTQLEAYNPSAALSAARDFFWGELCDWYLELIKPRMRDDAEAESRQAARQTLATVLDQVLRLLHPFVPFITEALWEQLGAQAPQRGIEEALPTSELCVQAAWPRPRPAWEDEAVEAAYAQLQEAVRGIRDVRAKYAVPPRKRLPCVVRGQGPAVDALRELAHHVQTMAGLASVEIGADAPKPPNAATAVVLGLEAYVGEVFDPAKERKRLAAQEAKLRKQLEASKRKLANEKFTAKAPAHVVDAERRRLESLKEELARVAQALADLAG